MNVVVLNGSPKRGNSNTIHLTHSFLDGAGYQDAEIIEADAADVKPCRGCFACWRTTPGKCVIADDMGAILEKVVAADVLVWSFPLYYYGLPGHLKNIVDRQLPLNLPQMAPDSESGGHPPRFDLSEQRYAVISTCGFWTAHGNYDAVTAMFDRIYGANQYARVFCGQGEAFSFPALEADTGKYLRFVKQAGSEFHTGAISKETQAALTKSPFPRELYEELANAAWD